MNAADPIKDAARSWFVRLNDDATEADYLAFVDWIEADDAHRLAYDDVERLWTELDAPPAVAPANDTDPPVRRRPAWLYPALAAAAAVVLALGIGSLVLDRSAQVYAAGDKPRQIALADGTQITLNRRSELTVRLGRDRRDVVLVDGEAAFDVAHDPRRPFRVSADGREVQVLGTAFNVLSHGDRYSVSVMRGVVAVTPAGDPTVRLAAGGRIDQIGTRDAVVSTVDPALVSAWRNGVLVYRDARLGDIAADLSRYLDKPVRVSPAAGALRYTGVLTVGEEATMLRQLEDLLPLTAAATASGVILNAREPDQGVDRT